MAWTSLYVFALLAGQVAGIKTEPTPAIRPAATDAPKAIPGIPPTIDAPKTVPGTPPASSEPKAPLPSADALRNVPNVVPRTGDGEIPKDADSEPGRISGAGEIPNAANVLPPSDLSAETPPANVPAPPPNASERGKNQAQEMVAEALQVPPGGILAGQPWPLAQALAASTDKKQQLLVIHSYWQLAEAVAKYHFAFEQAKQFEQLRGRPADETALRAAQASAAATLRESELAVLSAQNDLAALVGLSADLPLPFPGDKPHVGGYRTNYQGLFGVRSPPPIARVIDRTLPIRFTAIKERAAAVQAAGDAYLAAADSYQANQADFAAVISSGGQLLHERRAFIETVCRYNHDIAEYAVAVLGPNVSVQQLVGALIETGRGAIEPRSADKPGDVRPAEFLQPMTPSGRLPSVQQLPAQPTLAPIEKRPAPPRNPPNFRSPPEANEADPIPAFNHSANKSITEPNRYPSLNSEPAETARSSNPEPMATASNDIAQQIQNPNPNRPNAVSGGSVLNDSKQNLSTALYPALVEAASDVRAKQLTLALHWDRSLPENSAKPMSLAECLAREAGGNRRETLAVYWIARQRAAEYQVLVQQADFLENLFSEALERRNGPAGAVEMLYLRGTAGCESRARRSPGGAGRGPIRIGAADASDGRESLAVGIHAAALGQLRIEPLRATQAACAIAADAPPFRGYTRPGRQRPGARRGRDRSRCRPVRRRRKLSCRRKAARLRAAIHLAANPPNARLSANTDRLQPLHCRLRQQRSPRRHPGRETRRRAGGAAVAFIGERLSKIIGRQNRIAVFHS